jgi:hypothetical protein
MVPHGPVPLFVELCAGTAALSLAFHARGAPLKSRKGAFKQVKPPVSRMGSKAGYAAAILEVLGLEQGQGARDGARYLWCEPDPGVRLLLEAYRDAALARAAADIIRGWAGEDPRALWERLRAEGPPRGLPTDAAEVARFLTVHAGTHPGGNGWRGLHVRREANDGFSPSRAGVAAALSAVGDVPAEVHADTRAVEPREVARWVAFAVRTMPQTLAGGARAINFLPRIAPSGAVRYQIDAPATGLLDLPGGLPAAIAPDARAIDPGPCLPPGTVCYMDPPYVGTTGYASDLPRADVVALARRWAAAGALVCISEQVAIPELVADGWEAIDISDRRVGPRRTFSKQQSEFLTLKRASQ